MSSSGCYSWCDPPNYFCAFCSSSSAPYRHGLSTTIRTASDASKGDPFEGFKPPTLRRETRHLSETCNQSFLEERPETNTKHNVSQEEGHDDPGISGVPGHELEQPAGQRTNGTSRRSTDIFHAVFGDRKRDGKPQFRRTEPRTNANP